MPDPETYTASLKKFSIYKKEDKNNNPYYLIINQESSNKEAYFCFQRSLKEGWEDLTNNQNALQKQEIELEYIVNEKGSRRVISLWSGLDFLT